MSEAVRILFELLRLGRSRPALLARAAMAEDRGLMLERRARALSGVNARKARRFFRRSEWWKSRAYTLRKRAERLA